MRPKFLEIEGLQSFEDVQSIDFETLSETGLFGIFGPTGSGKSTVLDAITLALYGSVSRANRNQGIINTASERVRVVFTFDLLKGNERKTYKIERVYRRKKGMENSAEIKSARLMEISGEDTVPLSDKAAEATDKIIELIGLSHDDFTRSVVLPQNKFQEFLLSRKADKRAMLERIFYLEEYGVKLAEKVGKKMAATRYKLERVTGALSQLGDASEKVLVEAESRMQAAREHRDQVEKELKNAEASLNEAKEVWELQSDLKVIESRKEEHSSKLQSVSEKKKLLEASVKAGSLEDFIHKYRETADNLKDTNTKLQEIRHKLPGIEAEAQAVRARYEEENAAAETEKPLLFERKAKFMEALGIKKEVSALDERIILLRSNYKSLKEQLALKDGEIAAQKTALEQREEKIRGLKSHGAQIKANPDYRSEVQRGVKLEEELKSAEKDIKNQEFKLKEQLDKIALLSVKQASLSKQFEGGSGVEELTKLFERNSSIILAEKLQEGEECPVCGSTHHPKADFHSPGTVSDALKQNGLLAAQLLEERTLNAEIRVNLENKAQTEKHLDELRQVFSEKLQAFRNFEAQYHISDAAGEYKKIQENDREADRLEKQIKEQEEGIGAVRGYLEKASQERLELATRFAAVEADGISLNGQKKEKGQKVLELTGGKEIEAEILAMDGRINSLSANTKLLFESLKKWEEQLNLILAQRSTLENQKAIYEKGLKSEEERLGKLLKEKGFENIEEAENALLTQEEQKGLADAVNDYETQGRNLEAQKNMRLEKLKGRSITEEDYAKTAAGYEELKREEKDSIAGYEGARNAWVTIKSNFERWLELSRDVKAHGRKLELLEQIQKLLKGNSFIEYISEERLKYIAMEATETLGVLTKFRYALELDTENGFVIRDNANGGVHRLVTSLSGGETFLTSLSLALALSKQIQLKGQSPLEFFFLDEGFGTLDSGLLDAAMDSLERLSSRERVIGLISHVPEMKNRIARRLIITPPTVNGKGSQARIEKA